MKVRPSIINESLNMLKSRIWENDILKKYTHGEPPLRSELFSTEQMGQYGKTLAGTHVLGPKVHPEHQLLSRLAENESILVEVHNLISEAVKANRQITPAGEWLLDNFYLIEEHIHTGERHLPKGYSRELPRLLNGNSAGLPRVYDIAKEIISHGEGHIDPESLRRFITSYQSVTPLKLGELWAIPIMLRLALIENLRRVAVRVAAGRVERDYADSWADQMIDIAEKDPKSLILVIADMARSEPPMSTPFVSELVRRIQGQSPALALPLTWIEQRLAEQNQTTVQLIQDGNQQQASDQVSISNSIGSLRFLGSMDWREFVESMSHVDMILHKDPSNDYISLDFSTRDRYRHIIESVAKRCGLSELEVAHKSVLLAEQGAEAHGFGDRKAHVGYYLIGKGLSLLEKQIKARNFFSQWGRGIVLKHPLFFYLWGIILLTLFFSWLLLEKVKYAGLDQWLLWGLAFVLVLSTSYLSVALMNWLATLIVKPDPLPRFDFLKGIPPEFRSLVIVPCMLVNEQNIEDLVENLEVRFLANQDGNLHFGLLTDFVDSSQAESEEDTRLVELVSQRISDLNIKYPGSGHKDIFFLFHRARTWNPAEKIWMGYERKRGKLSALNSLLRNGSDHSFSRIVGKTDILQTIRYVITLDADTQLPRDSARQFIAAMAHPLNRPKYDIKKQRVTEGYGILQPRVAMSLPGTNRSKFARLFGSEPGIDPYTRTISDVYQDLFGEGSFIGKGIYDVDIFEQVLNNRFPENRILSHDLLEGCYIRSGLLSDVLLMEEYPAAYLSDVKRRIRWIRGDWQLIPWLFPILPRVKGNSNRNPLSLLSWWKILDNLRRSLVPVAFMLLLFSGWTILSSPVFWTLAVIGIIALPTILTTTISILKKPEDLIFIQHLKATMDLGIKNLYQAGFNLMSLPFEAFYSMVAIIKTCGRLIISKKHLLEWDPAVSENMQGKSRLVESIRIIWISPFISTVSIIGLVILAPMTLLIVWPVLLFWLVFPLVAWYVSIPLLTRAPKLTDKQFMFLRVLARKTWSFFETFAGPDDNWLPPDNYQDYPVAVIAHRTSPTNIGLSLLANLSAYDFGYIYINELLERTSRTFDTLSLLERFRGHFYNWYDTITLKPLRPHYISSVDSGNLAGHLLTLKQGLLELPDQPITGPRLFEGLKDTLQILVSTSGETLSAQIVRLDKELDASVKNPPHSPAEYLQHLERLKAHSSEIVQSYAAEIDQPYIVWAKKLLQQCQNAIDGLSYDITGAFETIPTLRQLSLKSALAKDIIKLIDSLVQKATAYADMDYDFLYDKSRHLQSIGYNVEDRLRDSSYYDLLASEARLSSFVAIAQGKLPQESWFALGRLLTSINGESILLSWSGSMFEYLMPLIVMPNYENSLLYQTCKAAVYRQIEYGNLRGVPWGISESGYNNMDVQQNYQYRAFGVPGLGLKRGLSQDLVIAPYASAMALMIAPEKAYANLEHMAEEGFMGEFGFYEAIDYTPVRVPRGQSGAIVKSFMAHHQGMSLLSLSYLLLNHPMQRRFESDPLFQATLLLLQERIPRVSKVFLHTTGAETIHTTDQNQALPVRIFDTPSTSFPEVNLLSNGGRYQVMITNSGAGYSHWKDIAVTRWREDSTSDNWGSFCYIRDAESGDYWSTTYQPTLKKPERYEAIFSEGRAEFRRRDFDIDTHSEMVVSPEDDLELRRVKLTNRSRTRRIIDITSYAEVILAPQAADLAHPAFSNLFVQTEIILQRQAIVCTRRPRSVSEVTPWMFHLMTVHGTEIKNITYETDRAKFIGRGNTLVAPYAMTHSEPLSGSQGSVLDPIVAIQYQIVLEPEGSATIDMITGVTLSREDAVNLIEKYQDKQFANRVFELAWTHSQVVLRQINANEADAQLYGRLTGSVIYANSSLRAKSGILKLNNRGQSGLWGYSISGDLPIVLLLIEDPSQINLVRQLVQAHAYWRLKGLAVDLVIWNEDHAGYRQLLQDQILGLIAAGIEANVIDRPGGIFVRSGDQISPEDRILFQTVARVIINDNLGALEAQINKRGFGEFSIPHFKPTLSYRPAEQSDVVLPRLDLLFFNGLGGFTPDGREYIITTSENNRTPAPWVNVLANPEFGTVISEKGLAYTWALNAHEYRITPWNNDPVTDSGGEAIYIRDEESGHFWSPTPLIESSSKLYVCRHGFGYSVFEHNEGGIVSELYVYVDIKAPVKYSVLKIRNESGRNIKLSVTGYVEWVLGDMRHKTAMYISTSADMNNSIVYASNPYNKEIADRVAFLQTDHPIGSLTCDRTEFLGRNRTMNNPSALHRSKLSGKKGLALDPCAAIQVNIEIPMAQEHEVVFRLGSGRNQEEVNNLISIFRQSGSARIALESVWYYWNHTLGAVQIETPDPSVDVLANGWLLYQTLACRVWARSGFYQSGGAFGFRDQLQDVMALVHTRPELLREHLLLFAGHQFQEGDVQHWWHPPIGRGVRTHCSDDYLWLPLAASRYVLSTGDTGVLHESISFLTGRPVNPDDDSYYDLPNRSDERATLYEHCKRSILFGLKFGDHGLPLIGTCDWNDGMNLVGNHGKGESVWLGFFLIEILNQFIRIAQSENDAAFVELCKKSVHDIQQSVEENAWDGAWYRRAYFDNATPLGSSSNEECQIDSISQSWSVLSGAGDINRSKQAMESVNSRLVHPEHSLVQLLDPPFDKSDLNPGYIKGYVPGVRENGGQYTHAAIWTAMAYAKLGDSKKAWEVLNMINPVNHTRSAEQVSQYKVEPYVLAADVYALPPHTGRGGWSWYTGSAGWMYRLILESLLGLRLEVDKLFIQPCVPDGWASYKINYRYRQTFYRIAIIQGTQGAEEKIITDGVPSYDKFIRLVDDGGTHEVIVNINRRTTFE